MFNLDKMQEIERQILKKDDEDLTYRNFGGWLGGKYTIFKKGQNK